MCSKAASAKGSVTDLDLAAYNAGLGNVTKYGGISHLLKRSATSRRSMGRSCGDTFPLWDGRCNEVGAVVGREILKPLALVDAVIAVCVHDDAARRRCLL